MPVNRRYSRVWLSTGKKPIVAPYSGAMLAMVARLATGMSSSPGPKNSTNLPTTPWARSISVTRSTRSVAVAPSAQPSGEPETDHLGQEHRDRLTEHRRLGLDPTDAPADHSEAVDHGRVRIGADQ